MPEYFVFDTNPLISGFLFRKSVPRIAYEEAVRKGNIVSSLDTLNEVSTVFLRDKFEKYLPYDERLLVLEEFEDISELLETKGEITACRDPKDDKFLELAVAANASCIITGDDDLLVLHPFRKIPILNASDFLAQF
jgi:putative PIN family toxin of toxin-antitoxin system